MNQGAMVSHGIELSATVVASKDQVSSPLQEGETAILNIKSGIYYGLDEVGARVWELIQTPRIVSQVRDTLLEEYEVDAEQCEADLLALLNQLAESGLVEKK